MKAIQKEIGRRVKQHRIAAFITQGQLAERAGISMSTVSSMETGYYAGSIDKLYRIAKALNVNANGLFPPIGE